MGEKSQSWLLLSVEGGRQYGGNLGYKDELGKVYRYDSNVGNSKNLKPGDLAFLRGREKVYGAALIENITTEEGEKTLNRCPECKKTNIKKRKHKTPLYRCHTCKNEFNFPVEESVHVKKYSARFGKSFVSFKPALDARDLLNARLRPGDQMSMEAVNPFRIDWSGLKNKADFNHMLKLFVQSDYEVPEKKENNGKDGDEGDYGRNGDNERTRILRSIAERRGQPKFRKKLLERFENRCAISNCSDPEALEAAHISPYISEKDNHVKNGLLLRSDIHTLFDLDLIGVNPASLKIGINNILNSSSYRKLEGKKLNIPRGKPSKEALIFRWEMFKKKLK